MTTMSLRHHGPTAVVQPGNYRWTLHLSGGAIAESDYHLAAPTTLLDLTEHLVGIARGTSPQLGKKNTATDLVITRK